MTLCLFTLFVFFLCLLSFFFLGARVGGNVSNCKSRASAVEVFFRAENGAEMLVCLLKSMRNDETTWKLLKAVHGTHVVSVHWQRLDQHVLRHCSGQTGYLIGDRVIGISHQYRDNPSQFDCHTVADFAGDVTKRLSTTTAGALMHGGHWMEERSVMRKVRAASSGEAEFRGLGTGEVTRQLTKHICREERERADEKKKLVAHFDSMASHMEQQLGASESCNDKMKWLWMRQGIDKIELWTLTNLMRMNLVAGVECLVQQPRAKITGAVRVELLGLRCWC